MTDLVNKGVAVIKEAVALDNSEKYEEALLQYKRGLEYLIQGVKYEKNKKSKQIIQEKITEYLNRAEELSKQIEESKKPKKKAVKAGGAKGDDDKDDDADAAKLKGALSSAIVTEKPNVRWEDVAGLETAKSLLKEAVLLPIKVRVSFWLKLLTKL